MCLNKALIVFLLVAITMAALALAQMPHRAVLENDAFENQLPPHLRNHFYRTPRVREALARSSLLGPGESAVVETRQAENIPRSEIYSVLTHAGLVPRRRFF